MKHISLFSGIGGFDLAAEWMGWENIAHCEWNPFGQRVLKYYWTNSISYHDITKTDFSIHRGFIDIVTGGFPCQPYSVAGKRKGKEDERHLWPEMLRAIREIQPRWVVGENVRGIINWDGGLVFNEVQADLEAEGYKILPFLLPAASVNAPHERYRTWFVACNSKHHGLHAAQRRSGCIRKIENPTIRCDFYKPGSRPCPEQPTTNTGSTGCQEFDPPSEPGSEGYGAGRYFEEGTDWQNFPTQSPVCNGDDGIPAGLDGITFSKWRNESIKAGGNAIVPQVVYQIFKAIEAYESQHNRKHSNL